MQKLVAGAFSTEHQVAVALQELLSMEDFSHGCLEIFAPRVKGLIGISDNREIVAAQISPDGPTGMKALKTLLRVHSGRYAFREGHRVAGGGDLSVTAEDLRFLAASIRGASTSEMAEQVAPGATSQGGEAAPVAPEPRLQNQLKGQRPNKGQTALEKMRAAVASRTAARLPALSPETLEAIANGLELPVKDTRIPEAIPAAPEKEMVGSVSDEIVNLDAEQIATGDAKADSGLGSKAVVDLSPLAGPSPGALPNFSGEIPQLDRISQAEALQAKQPAPYRTSGRSSKSLQTGDIVENLAGSIDGAIETKISMQKGWAASQLLKSASSKRKAMQAEDLTLNREPVNVGAVKPESLALEHAATEAGLDAVPGNNAAVEAKSDVEDQTLIQEASQIAESPFSATDSEANLDEEPQPYSDQSVGEAPYVPSYSMAELNAIQTNSQSSSFGVGSTALQADSQANQDAYLESGQVAQSSAQSDDRYMQFTVNEFLEDDNSANCFSTETVGSSSDQNSFRQVPGLLDMLKSKTDPELASARRARSLEGRDSNSPRISRTMELASVKNTEKLKEEGALRQRRNILKVFMVVLALAGLVEFGRACDEVIRVQVIKGMFNEGKISKEQCEHVLEATESALQWHWESAKLRYYHGLCLRRVGQPEKALEEFNLGLQLFPQDPYLLTERAFTNLRLGKYQEAVNDYNKLLADKKNQTPEAYSKRAFAFMNLGRYDAARADLLKVKQSDFESDATGLSLAECEAQLGNFKTAEQLVREVLKANPNDPEAAYTKLGFVLWKAKQFAEAKKALLKSVAIKPTPAAYLQLSELARAQNNLPEVIDYYSQYLYLQPQDRNVLLARARTQVELGRLEAGLTDYNNIEATNQIGDSFAFFSQRAALERRMGKSRAVISDLEKCRSLKPEDRSLALDLAAAYEKAGHFVKAVEVYSSILATGPQDAEILIKRGNAYQMVKDYASAQADFSKAINSTNPATQVEAYFRRGMSCYAQGLYDQADVDFDNVLRINHNHPEAKKMKGEIAVKAHKTLVLPSFAPAQKLEPSDKAPVAELIKTGYSLLQNENAEAAIKFFAKAIQKESYNADARRYLAYALLAAQEPSEAVDQLENLEKIRPLNAEEFGKYIDALRAAGQSKAAIQSLRIRLAADPSNITLRLKLATLFVALNKPAEFREVCLTGMKQAKTAEDYDTLNSLYSEMQQKLGSSAAKATEKSNVGSAKDLPGG
jgi:tetratricopeptide (TPR) repeat protein